MIRKCLVLGMPGRARWRGQTQTGHRINPFSTALFCLGAKMLCNRIAREIVGDSIAALRRPFYPVSFVRAPTNLLSPSDLSSMLLQLDSPNIEQDKKGCRKEEATALAERSGSSQLETIKACRPSALDSHQDAL